MKLNIKKLIIFILFQNCLQRKLRGQGKIIHHFIQDKSQYAISVQLLLFFGHHCFIYLPTQK